AHRTHERAVGHALTVREQDLRAAALDLRLLTIRGCEIRERRLRPDTRSPLEYAPVAAAVHVRIGLRPLGGALRTAERATGFVVAAPFDDPVLAAIGEDHALRH